MPPADAAAQPRALVEFALAALPAMRLADGAFCHEVRAPDRRPRGRSPRYTLMVAIGLQRAQGAGLELPLDPGELRDLVRAETDLPSVAAGDLGLLLWSDARAGLFGEPDVLERLAERVAAQGGLRGLEGLELSWIVTGLVAAQGVSAERPTERLLAAALGEQLRRAETPSGLFLHRGSGARARFPNFATQIYGVLACALARRVLGDERALRAACRAADRLCELQLADGGWPWLYDAERGMVVERYELYSVHQDAMAPMALLELAEASGEPRYRDAALAGLAWIRGGNELGAQMLDREAGMLYRSIRRRRPLDRVALYANTLAAAAGMRGLTATAAGVTLELNRSDRPYHLGWLLEAWAGREDGAQG